MLGCGLSLFLYASDFWMKTEYLSIYTYTDVSSYAHIGWHVAPAALSN